MANFIEIRRVEVRESDGAGGYRTIGWRLQYRTKDMVGAVLGVIPLAASWSSWTDMETVVDLQDGAGNPSS